MRYPAPGGKESQRVQLERHWMRLGRSLSLAPPPDSHPEKRILSPLSVYQEWSERAYVTATGSSGTIRLRWSVTARPDGGLRETVYALPHRDPQPDEAFDRGVILIDGTLRRDPRDRGWQAKRSGPPVLWAGQVAHQASDWDRITERVNMGKAERKWTGYHGLDGAFVVQRNSAGDACETTWGTIAWLESKDWADADGGDGGNIVVSPTTSPRLPSLTLARLWEDLRPRGWTLQEKPIHASHLHGSGGCFVVLSSIRGLVPVASWLDEDVTHPLWNQVGNYPACLRTLRERLWQSPYPPVTQGEGPLEGL